MAWSRNTLWQQGYVLAQEHFQTVNLTDANDAELAVAISHSCDIANDNLDDEPAVEFILAWRVEQKDGNFTYGKNPRTLHLDYEYMGNTVTLELIASKKKTVQKSSLEKIQPDVNYRLIGTRQVQVLQSWLAARYRRPALPSSLFERLRYVSKDIEKAGKRNPSGILFFRLSYEPEGELLPEEPYKLDLHIVYTIDKNEHHKMAEDLAQELLLQFPESLRKTKEHGLVDLKCKAVSEIEFTVREMRDTIPYRAEHLSYRTDPPGPVI